MRGKDVYGDGDKTNIKAEDEEILLLKTMLQNIYYLRVCAIFSSLQAQLAGCSPRTQGLGPAHQEHANG